MFDIEVISLGKNHFHINDLIDVYLNKSLCLWGNLLILDYNIQTSYFYLYFVELISLNLGSFIRPKLYFSISIIDLYILPKL